MAVKKRVKKSKKRKNRKIYSQKDKSDGFKDSNILNNIFALVLFILIFTAVFNEIIQYEEAYYFLYEKVGTYENIDKVTAQEQTRIMIDYFNNEDKYVQSDFFNDKEKKHLLDVKNIFVFLRLIMIAALAPALCYFIILFMFKTDLKELVHHLFDLYKRTAKITVAFCLGLMILITFNFAVFFEWFHRLIFTNNLWLMNPVTDKIILLVPESFFKFFLIEILAIILLISGILLLKGYVFVKIEEKLAKKRKRKI